MCLPVGSRVSSAGSVAETAAMCNWPVRKVPRLETLGGWWVAVAGHVPAEPGRSESVDGV